MSLADEVPREWASSIRPFLQRADEFQERVPVVAYFLRTHAVYLAMKMWRKEDGPGKAFIVKLLDTLESEKKRLEQELADVDGRVLLTQYALRIFSRADDEERSDGVVANMNLVRLFFTASLLFEATAQFTDDGTLDPIATEKRDYARYIAVEMKKAMDKGVPYVSPNRTGGMVESNKEHEGESTGGGGFSTNFVQSQQPGYGQWSAQYVTPQPPPPSHEPPETPMWSGPESTNTSSTQQQQQSTPLFQTTAQPNNSNDNSNIAAAVSGVAAPKGPTMDAIIEAQNYAKQAVSALQFYDHEVACKMLRSALDLLAQR
ncbi:Vta1 like, putative [Trypanosoma equiperdum]|uniref:Vta1/callose synthase N-terminal domain-containing protein n=2 Tax=Trypanozoon TaxID=39700 RepID=Q57XT4_TRYB2|nr:hypothetical protein, conserved [Trypanosoma brucei brucei TREU927]AAX69585.1 hypothetical protein, conserved [Trypanosoma brucei]AAZ12775.1 hypothetical protein, conserved [Trypanosoma brucei brucei TREU927]SCU64539.1 Vta1 like, putative [Trypanosoma equiperdum]